MSVIDFFSEKADLYAAARPRYPQYLYEFLASLLNSRQRVWDCATGNGQAAIDLADYFSEVYATDVSVQQINHAMPKTNVDYSVQPAEETNFPDAYFDAVIVAQALHWFDLERFWLEVKRVLLKNGLFAAWGYDCFSISPEINRVVEENIVSIIKPYFSSRIQLLYDGYCHVGFPFEPIQVPLMEIEVAWNLSNFLDYIHTWSATRQCMQQQGMEFYETASSKLSSVWGDPQARKKVTMKMHIIAGYNR